MPIHDQSYRHYAGTRETSGRAWTIIASAGIRSMAGKRRFLGLLLLAWIPFVVYAVRFYLAANYSQVAPLLAVTLESYRHFFDVQVTFVFFITIWVGAGLIANDKRANALQIYLSKPLTRSEYIAGKAAILVAFLTLVTWLPAILLLLLHMLFTGSFDFIRANLVLFPAITLYSLLQVLLATFTILALSSLSNSSRFVAIMYAGAIFFTDAIHGVLTAVTNSSAFSWLSVTGSLGQVGNIIFRMKPLYPDTPWQVSLLVVVAMMAVSLLILERRVRGVEVVS
jgi:ABC-2 type transport system permease protein